MLSSFYTKLICGAGIVIVIISLIITLIIKDKTHKLEIMQQEIEIKSLKATNEILKTEIIVKEKWDNFNNSFSESNKYITNILKTDLLKEELDYVEFIISNYLIIPFNTED